MMFRRLSFAALVALILPSMSCVIAIGNWKVSSYDEEEKKTSSATSVNQAVAEDVQRQVAVHEAGHAIAMAILFGADEVTKVVVNTHVDKNGWLGHANWSNEITNRYTLELNRKSAAVSLAARSADTFINGAPVSGSSTDLKHANDKITHSYISWGLGGTPMVYGSRREAPKVMQKQILKDLLDAEAYADEIVKANLETIKALANDIMGITPKGNKRIMDADVFRAFCDLHSLVDPRASASPKKAK